VHRLIADNLEAIRVVAREFGVIRLEGFGSVTTEAFDPQQSDIDFLVQYPPGYDFGLWLGRYFASKERLESLLGRPVDLVMTGAMRNPRFIKAANESRRLLYAASYGRLDVAPPRGKARTMIPLVARHLGEIAALCRRDGVRRLDLFGSATGDRFDEVTSDLDFVADFADTDVPGYADRYLAFAEALEELFGRPVDVVTERSIRTPWWREAIDATRQPVYDERDEPAVA
jgi:predicted nucleotidyltransferase